MNHKKAKQKWFETRLNHFTIKYIEKCCTPVGKHLFKCYLLLNKFCGFMGYEQDDDLPYSINVLANYFTSMSYYNAFLQLEV